MEAESGRVLYEQDADRPRLIASTTKLMTALVALESGHDLNETVVIPAEAEGVEGSSLYLKAGESVKLEVLLYGLLLHSGNDAAVAIADFCAGSVDAFVARMNEKALELGMEHSHFSNPSGLNQEEHYSTARDMARLAQACLANEQLREMTATRSIALDGRCFTNHNKLLWRYEGCVGLKTGYTERAGRTLVSAATRDGMTLIVVTLDDPNDWKDHAALFDYGFATYHMEDGVQAGQRVCGLPVRGSLILFVDVAAEASVRWPIKAGEHLEWKVELHQTELTAPVQQGTPMGTLYGVVDGQRVAEVPLVCRESVARDQVEPMGWTQRLHSWLTGRA